MSRADVDPDNLDANPCTKYDLIGNVVHVGDPNSGNYKVNIYHEVEESHILSLLPLQPTGGWYEVEDLRVTSVMAHQVAISGKP